MTTKPSREAFTEAYLDRSVSVNELCLRYRVSHKTVKHWARRSGLALRPTGGYRTPGNAPRIILKDHENHCVEQHDGPLWGDPTPDEIVELSAYCRARRIVEGHVAYVYIEQPQEDFPWVA